MPNENVNANAGVKTPPPNDPRVCPSYGHSLTELGPNGECLKCVLNWAFLPENDPSAALRYGHFEIELDDQGTPIALGAGGMAVTYRARDTILNSVVALKVIGRKLAENPIVRARFLREARAAAQIHHPNVARVTHYGEQNGECYYAMELVQGETLEARVKRTGPLPVAQALEVIEQAARALVAAEKCGVVHRDIKPSNVMIESHHGGSLFVKIIDYGVAKVLASQPDATEQTQAGFIGTPAFASPEQFSETGSAPVDMRSDIYSLGITLWYLLTGRTPLSGETREQIRASQKHLPVEQLKMARVPTSIVDLLRRMLALDPANRPQSGDELLEQVHRAYLRFEPRAASRRKRLIQSAIAAGFAALLFCLAFYFYERRRAAAQEERSIAVLPFENLSAKEEDAYFTVGMQSEIAGDLAKLGGVRVIGTKSTQSYAVGEQRDLASIARDLGARHLLEGTVVRDHGQMRVGLRLVDSRDPAHAWTKSYERPTGDVFSLQSEITRAIAGQLQTRLSPNENTALDTPPTNDLRAYDLYLQARALLPFAGAPTHGQLAVNGKRAIPMLQEALNYDPNFVLAYCELSKWHDELFFSDDPLLPGEIAVDHRSLSEDALEKARRVHPDSGAVHLALAKHALQINHNAEEADVQIQQARRSLFNNVEFHAIAGRVARRRDRWNEAVAELEHAVTLEPRDTALRELLGSTYAYMRRFEDADRAYASALALADPARQWDFAIIRAILGFESSGDVAPLRQVVAADIAAHGLDALEDEDLSVYAGLEATWSRDVGDISRFVSSKHRTFSWSSVLFPDAWLEALAARLQGHDDAARKAFAAARPQMEENVTRNPTRGVPLSYLAIIDAGLGRSEQALEEAKRACEMSPFDRNNLDAMIARCNMAVVYAWTGHNDLAVAELKPLVERPAGGNDVVVVPSYGDFRVNPLWDPLRSDPNFDALVQRLAPAVPAK